MERCEHRAYLQEKERRGQKEKRYIQVLKSKQNEKTNTPSHVEAGRHILVPM